VAGRPAAESRVQEVKGSKISSGLLMYRSGLHGLQVFLVHPGGPFWTKKDEGAWSIPKGEVQEGDDLLDTAKREFEEETGTKPEGIFLPLGSIRQRGGKTVHAWAFEGDWDERRGIRSNTFPLEWPPRSGRIQEFPEVDKGAFFDADTAAKKMNEGQVELLQRLRALLSRS